jgi:hypothetical protein
MIGNQKHLIFGKRDRYLHLEHCRSKSRAPKNISDIRVTSNCWILAQKRAKVNSNASTMHIGKTLTATAMGMKLYHRQTEFYYTYNINISFK